MLTRAQRATVPGARATGEGRIGLAGLSFRSRPREFFAGVPVRRWAGLCGLAVCLGGLYALGAWVPFWYPAAPNAGAAFFAPAGLTLATLRLTPRRTWPLWVAAFAAAEFGVDVAHHQTVAMALGFALANAVEPLVGAQLFLWSRVRAAGFGARVVGFFIFAVALAPVVGAVIGASTSVLFSPVRPNWWTTAATWWVGDALGVLVVASVVLLWWRPPDVDVHAPGPLIAAMALTAGGAIVVSAVLWRRPMVYLVLPVIVWAALTAGSRAVSAVCAATAFAAQWAALTGRAGLEAPGARPEHQLAFLQVFLGVTVATGLVLNAEIIERRRSEHRARQAERDLARSEREAVMLAEAERHSLTRDTHDIVGHGLNAILLQAGAARRVLDKDPELVRDLLGSIEAVGRRACDDLDFALTLVGQSPALDPSRGLKGLPELVAMLEAAGLKAELRTEGEPREIPTLVDWSAYRIVQEALTNVVKHAPGASVVATVRYGADDLDISVVNQDGQYTVASERRDGRGIKGMRERATALGGSLSAARTARGGFRIDVRLPLARV